MDAIPAKQAAKQLGISYRTLLSMVRNGSIEHVEARGSGPNGVNYLIPADEIAKYKHGNEITLSTQDVADAIGKHDNTVRWMIKTGKLATLPAPTAGSKEKVRVAASEVERYIAGQG
jgi:excisionase family DNA binding protein